MRAADGKRAAQKTLAGPTNTRWRAGLHVGCGADCAHRTAPNVKQIKAKRPCSRARVQHILGRRSGARRCVTSSGHSQQGGRSYWNGVCVRVWKNRACEWVRALNKRREEVSLALCSNYPPAYCLLIPERRAFTSITIHTRTKHTKILMCTNTIDIKIKILYIHWPSLRGLRLSKERKRQTMYDYCY